MSLHSTSDTFCTANVGASAEVGYIACAAPQSAPLHNPHDVERFQHEYRSDYPHRAAATFDDLRERFDGMKLDAALLYAEVNRRWPGSDLHRELGEAYTRLVNAQELTRGL